MFHHPHRCFFVFKCFLNFKWDFFCFSLYLLPLDLSWGPPAKSLAQLSPVIHIGKISPEPSLLHIEQSQVSWPLLVCELLQSFNYLCDPSLDSFHQVYMCPVLRLILVLDPDDVVSQLEQHTQDTLHCNDIIKSSWWEAVLFKTNKKNLLLCTYHTTK